jgi:hypothetical protein
MEESRKVYGWLALLGFALFGLSSIAGQRVVVSPTCFNPDWNLARVVSRGAEIVRVESKVSINALTLKVR